MQYTVFKHYIYMYIDVNNILIHSIQVYNTRIKPKKYENCGCTLDLYNMLDFFENFIIFWVDGPLN